MLRGQFMRHILHYRTPVIYFEINDLSESHHSFERIAISLLAQSPSGTTSLYPVSFSQLLRLSK